MNREELELKIQALVDNELAEDEISVVMREIEGSYEFRDEYVALLRLRKRLGDASVMEPPKEWFERASYRASRRALSWTGNLLFIGSYVLLLGYSLITLLRAQDIGIWVKVGVIGIGAGLVVLLLKAIGDRMKESRTDRYKGVMK